MSCTPGLKDYLNSSNKRLNDALKIAVAGNVIDLGINRNFDINASLKNSLRVGFAKDDFRRFKEKLDQEDQVVILGDNAGEIVFDKLLAEELSAMGKKITYLVKGGPILNDATRADALQVGMDQIARVVTTGSNHLGAPLAEISEEAAGILQKAGLVISKGQANFESLEHEEIANGKVFFLLKIKCECVGITAGSKFGDIVFFTR
ncbi:MAG: hypothetical protein A4E53_04549 [Pelotomaculum sp. PtaB.Bin104]|nr:MAG: hypothetical protein A4E53_04549 [Pelotomaculum sp. PtaB.Bin104]